MEDLFYTNIRINNKEARYHIIFDSEKYSFIPVDEGERGFSFKREEDTWHAQDELDEETLEQAVDALEEYLMKQH
jgi:hypothetical protein